MQASQSEAIQMERELAKESTVIRELNDRFRQNYTAGERRFTHGFRQLPEADRLEVIRKVGAFDSFSEGDDPHDEHDFGMLDHAGQGIIWQISYAGADGADVSPDPANPAVTHRVLTVMLASEY